MTCIPEIFLFKSKDQKLLLQLLTKACVHNSLLCFFFFEQSKLGLWNKKLDVAVPEAVLLYRKIKNFLLSLVLFLQSYFFVSPPPPMPSLPMSVPGHCDIASSSKSYMYFCNRSLSPTSDSDINF